MIHTLSKRLACLAASTQIARTLAKSALALAITASLLPLSAQAPVDLRIALVIGNAAYAGAAALANPANDAKAMGEALRGLGFAVVEIRDGSRAQMAEAIGKVQASLKGKQGIGMLYYAGHGLQVDWRNFMVPIDAKLAKAADVAEQTIDLGSVIDAFKAAGNRMNIVVLDACRDNPFETGGLKVATGKGLAPLDAPTGTFLAYATAPGNVADDGAAQGADGKTGNGLYTQFLLQELKKPAAKIEDVFKRVRLNVRQKSEGRQIPWESTSLEDDFYFNAGLKPTQKESDSDKEKAFAVEKADWDKIKDSKTANDFYAFLQKYPSGLITQQASAALERLSNRAVVAQPERGGVAQMPNQARFRVGDIYESVATDGFTGVERRRGKLTVNKIENGLVYAGDNVFTVDGGTIRNRFIANFDPPRMDQPGDDFIVGKKWGARTIQSNHNGTKIWRNDSFKIVAFEEVTVPAGTFKTYKIELNSDLQSGERFKGTFWVEPGWGLAVKTLREVRPRQGPMDKEVIELVSRVRGQG